jgi:hypothetical protein
MPREASELPGRRREFDPEENLGDLGIDRKEAALRSARSIAT